MSCASEEVYRKALKDVAKARGAKEKKEKPDVPTYLFFEIF
jgi:hypothetical protein